MVHHDHAWPLVGKKTYRHVEFWYENAFHIFLGTSPWTCHQCNFGPWNEADTIHRKVSTT